MAQWPPLYECLKNETNFAKRGESLQPALPKNLGQNYQSFFQHRHLKGGVKRNKKHIFQSHHLDFLLKKTGDVPSKIGEPI